MSATSLPLLSAFSSLHDAFHSTAFVVARNALVFLVALFWLSLAYWVHRDARRRIADPWLVGTATLLGLVPYVGPLVYLLFRPAETLADGHARRVEIQALEERLQRPPASACPACTAEVEPGYLVCPVCTTRLRERCAGCDAPLERLWQACPYCARPVDRREADLDAALTAEASLLAATADGRAPARA